MNVLTPVLRALIILSILLSTVPAAGSPAASFPTPAGSLLRGSLGWVSTPTLDKASSEAGSSAPAWQASPPTEQPYHCAPDYQDLVDRVAATLQSTFSLPPRIITAIGLPDPDDAEDDEDEAWTYAAAPQPGADPACGPLVPQAAGALHTCLIVFLPPAQRRFAEYAGTATSELDIAAAPDLFDTIAHELYHCHQFHVVDDVANAAPAWITEGTAAWAGMWYAYGGTGVATSDTYWRAYLGSLGLDLFSRDYDAIGFFAHLYQNIARNGTDALRFWLTLDELIRLPWSTAKGNPVELNAHAFNVAVIIGGEDFLAAWAMGTVREQDWGDSWWLTGPGLGDLRPPDPEVAMLIPDVTAVVRADPRAIAQARIQFEPGAAVLRIEVTGDGGVHWHEENRDDVFSGAQTFTYCVDPAGCTCPDGSTPLGDDARTLAPDETATIALTGGAGAGSARFTRQTPAELCGEGEASGCDAEGTACSCEMLLPGSFELDDYELEGTRFLFCRGGSGPLVTALNVGFTGPEAPTNFATVIATQGYIYPDCQPVTLPESGLTGCLHEEALFLNLYVLVSDNIAVSIDVDHVDGITPDLVQMAITIADHAVLVILGG